MYNLDNPHFLQSYAWQDFHRSLGHQVLTDSGDGWSYLAIVEQSFGIKRLYCPYGPTVSDEQSFTAALLALKTAAKNTGAAYLRIQPLGLKIDAQTATKQSLRPINYSQPSQSWAIDLSVSQDELLADMKQNNRSIIRNYHKKGLTYRTSQDPKDMSELLRLLHQVAMSNKINLHSDDYLNKQASTLLPIGAAKLHFIDFESKVTAAALTYQSEKTVYYAHAAADHDHRKLNASTVLLGEIIFAAKADKKAYVDLFGVTTSADPHHAWAGFTKFKQSFGGHLVPLSSTYELPIAKSIYKLYSLLKKLR